MADIKTHLRELSVAAGIVYRISYKNPKELFQLTPKQFYQFLQSIISNNISNASNILDIAYFNADHYSIIENGIRLGEKIVDLEICDSYNRILWLGADTQKNDPIDLIVGNTGFSLKEESYILENMGLYKYLNLLTNSKFSRGLHVFEYFAFDEYNEWFRYTWNSMLNRIHDEWIFNNGRYTSKILIQDSVVKLIIDDKVISSLPATQLTINEYTKYTNSKSREKVFAKWINNEISNDPIYLSLKSNCSNFAGERLCSFVLNNLNPINLARLLQIYNTEYYYAKTTSKKLSIYHVPNIHEFVNEIKITDISYSVPTSQLNILTTITNQNTGNSLIFRNECRFSHGQFNGTPEAKMYYERGNDLSVIYNKIY